MEVLNVRFLKKFEMKSNKIIDTDSYHVCFMHKLLINDNGHRNF